MKQTSVHPALRFDVPSSIQKGVPLKSIMSGELIRLIGESLRAVSSQFNQRDFVAEASQGLDSLELNQRGQQIGHAIARYLPPSIHEAAPILIASFGPELAKTGGNGLAPFFYYPHAFYIADHGIDDFEQGMQANYEITKRISAEFSIRPYLVRYRDRCLAQLLEWASDPNPHVRRLVSEGTRPRLPWAMRLREFQQNPQFTLPLLELLKDDQELYVRRSVANHLGNILKDHPETGFTTCERWLQEFTRKKTPLEQADVRKWIVCHAVRHPAKHGEARAVRIRTAVK